MGREKVRAVLEREDSVASVRAEGHPPGGYCNSPGEGGWGLGSKGCRGGRRGIFGGARRQM